MHKTLSAKHHESDFCMDDNENARKCTDDDCNPVTGKPETHPVGQDSNHKTTIFDLPRQVWLEIYEHLNYPSYLDLRLTCHHFRDLIDGYVGLKAVFTPDHCSNPAVFSFLTSVALNDVQFEDARNSQKFNLERLLMYPSFLSDVSFTGATNLKLLQDIVTRCNYLQLIEMTMDCRVIEDCDDDDYTPIRPFRVFPNIDIRSPHPPKEPLLHMVECFKLVPGMQQDNNIRSEVVLSLLRATRSDRLRKVIFQCELGYEITLSHLLTITAELMEKHLRLEALFMAILNEEFLMSDAEAEECTYLDLYDEEECNYFRDRIVATGKILCIRKMGLAMINRNMQIIWGDFLKTQHHLVHLSLTVNIKPNTFSQEIFNAFCWTLQQLAIRGKFDEPFDFSHVSNCVNLKEICLHNLQENGGGGIIPRCINMTEIPDCLESLILFQVVARTQEVLESLRKLDKLSTLVVFKCGHAAGETGIGLETLQEILFKRSLQSILIVQFICGSTTEAEQVAGILYNMAKDAGNQANEFSTRTNANNNAPVPADGVEEVLNLPLVEGGLEDEMFLLPRHHNAQAPHERPVSRGDHRNPETGEVEEEVVDNAGEVGQCSGYSTNVGAGEEAAGESPGILSEDVTEVWKKCTDKNNNPATPDNDEDKADKSLYLEDSVPLSDPSSTRAIAGSPSSSSSEVSFIPEDFPPLQSTFNNNPPTDHHEHDYNYEEDYPEVVENADEEENGGNIYGMNMLQNILEHAMVDDPAQLERRNPNLQDNMILNQLHEINDNVELVLDVGDQDLGPVLDLFAAERLARAHNVQVGFILDGVIDIMNEDVVRSKWLCVEDSEGHLTYTLKISVEL